MIEVTNITTRPVSVTVRSLKSPRQFTILHIPAKGAGKNIFYLEEERATEYIQRAEQSGLIKTRRVNTKFGTGEKHANT
jgi:hypothetical protein